MQKKIVKTFMPCFGFAFQVLANAVLRGGIVVVNYRAYRPSSTLNGSAESCSGAFRTRCSMPKRDMYVFGNSACHRFGEEKRWVGAGQPDIDRMMRDRRAAAPRQEGKNGARSERAGEST
jgi:hypothetical protein